MSYSNFTRATQLAKKCRDYNTAGAQSTELLKKVEMVYGFKLSRQQYEYFQKYGYIMFFGTEVYGIYDNAFEGIYAGNAVVATLRDRKEYHLPNEWIPVFDYDDGYMAYLDYGNTNTENEPGVILAWYTGTSYEIVETIAEDFGDFLLELVEAQLGVEQE